MSNEIIEKIKAGESETMEFKPSSSQIKDIVETVSAFSNRKGGLIVIGVKDDGQLTGIDIGRKTIESLANKIKQNTDPKIYPSIFVEKISGMNIIIIQVEENKSKPVFAFDRVYKRVGKSNHRVSSEEIRKMALERKKIYWDGLICEAATLEDIDWKFIEESFIPLYEKISEKKIEGKPVDLLKSLTCIKKDKPTNAGILLFGKNPQTFFMNAYIALARYKWKEVYGEKLDYKEFLGNLFQQIDNCNNYIVEHTTLMSRLTPGEVRRRDIPEYGGFSVRELTTNAICHRDYEDQGGKIIIKMFDDRIEFYSIGGLPEWITPENIISEQYSRNPTITKVLAKVEYIEELGEGWDKIINEHKGHPLNPKMPKIKSSKNSTLVSLFSTKEKFEEERHILNKRQREIVEHIKKNGSITTSECASLLKISNDTSLRELSKLRSLGLIDKKGVGRGIYYVIK